MCGLIVVLRTVSFASYIFSDKLAIFLEMGLRSMLWSGIVGQGIYILRTCTKGIRGEIVVSTLVLWFTHHRFFQTFAYRQKP